MQDLKNVQSKCQQRRCADRRGARMIRLGSSLLARLCMAAVRAADDWTLFQLNPYPPYRKGRTHPRRPGGNSAQGGRADASASDH
jgi:hypothetical protein